MSLLEESRCIVSLAYDDALPCHFESVAPLLEENGLRGTFYVPCGPSFFAHTESWREVAAQGHELGNHTVFHPCHDQAWLDESYNLRNYTKQRWSDEVRLANSVLSLVDGRSVRSFGNTCHHNVIGSGENESSVEALAPDFFIAARGEYNARPINLKKINWFNLGTRVGDHASFEQLRADIIRMRSRGGWSIITFHGVGPRDHALHIDEEEHHAFIEWLSGQQDSIWVAPVRTVSEALKPTRRTLATANANVAIVAR